jgi:hypothetical protein
VSCWDIVHPAALAEIAAEGLVAACISASFKGDILSPAAWNGMLPSSIGLLTRTVAMPGGVSSSVVLE